jgi:hypothetical protein
MKTSGFNSRSWTGPALALTLTLAASPAMAQTAFGTGAFPKVAEIEKQLRRGVSTRADVQRVLGVPNGSGGALLPGYGERSAELDAYQLWFYQDIETINMKSEQNIMKLNMRQQILAVFFKGEVFHGYFWTSNDKAAEGKR